MQKVSRVELLEQKYDWGELTLWDFLCDGNYPSSWGGFFLREDIQDDLQTISEEIDVETKKGKTGRTIYPPINQVFRAFIPLKHIKVVILGQDPYPNPTSAVGLCFSVRPGNKINPSLRSIYTELKNEGFFPKEDGNLTHLPPQGVMLLNTALTVEKGFAGSHIDIWYNFSRKVIRYISENAPNSIWFLMGSKALGFSRDIAKEAKIIITSHPMPLAAYRGFRDYPAFMGSNAFRDINKHLKSLKRKPIIW